jgi:hypothetical protein
MYHIKPVKKTALDDVIDTAIRELSNHEIHTKEYATALERLTELYALKSQEKTDRISKDTLALVLGNLAGILMIVKHEELNVVTSKALSFVGKIK